MMFSIIKKTLLAAVITIPTIAQAATLSFTAVVDEVNDPNAFISTYLGVNPEVGDTVTASYSAVFDSLFDSQAGPFGGINYTIFGEDSAELVFDDGTVTGNAALIGGAYVVNVGNDVADPSLGDFDQWYYFTNLAFFTDASGALRTLDVTIGVADDTLARLDNEELFLEDSLAGWGLGYVAIVLDGGFTEEDVLLAGRVNLTAVPVPAAAWFFGSGLLALLGLRRRK